MRHSQNSPSDPKYTPTLNICDPPPESTPPSQNRIPPIFDNYMRHFQNPPLLSRIYPLLYQVRLPESTPSFQNIPPFSTTICDAPGIYPALPEYTLPPSLRNATLPESTHPSRIYPLLHHYMRHSHNRPLPPLNILMRHSRNPPLTQSIPF